MVRARANATKAKNGTIPREDGIVPRAAKARASGAKTPKEMGKDLQAKEEKGSVATATAVACGVTERMAALNLRSNNRESGMCTIHTRTLIITPIKWLSWSQTLKARRSTIANHGPRLESQTSSHGCLKPAVTDSIIHNTFENMF